MSYDCTAATQALIIENYEKPYPCMVTSSHEIWSQRCIQIAEEVKKVLVLGDPEPGTSVKEIGQAFEKYSPIYVNLCFFI